MGEHHREFDGAAGLDRRQLLKIGAWAAPVVVLAAAAPAAVASVTGTINLGFTHLSAWYFWGAPGQKTAMEASTSVQTTGTPGSTITSMTVVFTTSATGLSTTVAPVFLAGGSSWTTAPGVLNGTDIVYTFVWAGNLGINTTTLELRFRLAGIGTELTNAPVKQLVAVVSAPGAGGATLSTSALRYLDPTETLPPIPPLGLIGP